MVVESDSEKKRKITRACDICRRKKIKCDGPSKAEQGLKCSNCDNNNFTCTYVEAAKRKGPPKGYIESLENRNRRFEMLFRKMLPDYDYNSQVGSPIDRDNFETGCEADTSRWNKQKKELPTIENAFHPTQEIDDQSDDELEERMQQISVSAQCEDNTRYLGKSSSVYLMATLDQYKPPDEPPITREVMEQDRRPEFWMDREWIMEEKKDFPSVSYTAEELPPPDLLEHLVKIFFEKFNVYFPVLHRASFEADLHKRKDDIRFGGLLLLLCATASRYSDDPRVVPKDDKDEFGNVKNWRFAGAEFFAKFKMHCHSFILTAATLEDLQSIILMIIYLQGGPFSPACWALNSMGLVLAQDIGFHRKRVWGDPIQNELRKRAFWSFYMMDKHLSAMLGRPCTLNDENFDVELPSVLPDEVETEMQMTITQFNKLIELVAILGEVLRTIYVVNKRKRPNNANIPEPKRTLMDVAALDSKLHKWLESIPPELAWDPNCKDNLKFTFMCMLQTTYYLVQIYIHRPFISTPKRPSPLGYPSLSICTNAARSCIHVLSHLQERNKTTKVMDSWTGIGSFTSSVILIVSACEGRRNSTDPSAPIPEMKEINMGMQVVKELEARHLHAGRAHDILRKLVNGIGKIPTEESPNATSPATSNFSASSSLSMDSNLFLRGSTENLFNPPQQRRKIAKKPSHTRKNTQDLEDLPMSTNDLATHIFYPDMVNDTATTENTTTSLTEMANLVDQGVFPSGNFDFTAPTSSEVMPQSTFVQPPTSQMPKGYNDVNMAGINTLTDYDMLGNSNPLTNMFTSSPEDDTKPSVTQDAVPQQDLWSLLPDSTYNTQSEDWTNFFRFTQPM